MTVREVCHSCFRPTHLCVCLHCRQVANRTHILIIQHQRERSHPFGTTRIAQLTLARVRKLVTFGVIPKPLDLSPQAALLYPSEEAQDLAELPVAQRPDELIVLDGTWSHARVIYRENPWLQALPAVGLNPSTPGRYRIRKEPRPEYISTIESIVAALHLLEPETPNLDHPLEVFEQMIEEQIRLTKDHVAQRDYELSYDL